MKLSAARLRPLLKEWRENQGNDTAWMKYHQLLSSITLSEFNATRITGTGDDVRIGDTGDTLLHLAVLYGQQKSVHTLLEIPGIDVNVQNDKGETPFAVAKHEEIKKLLNSKQIIQNKKGGQGNVPLSSAVALPSQFTKPVAVAPAPLDNVTVHGNDDRIARLEATVEMLTARLAELEKWKAGEEARRHRHHHSKEEKRDGAHADRHRHHSSHKDRAEGSKKASSSHASK